MTIKMWHAQTGECLHTFSGHSDVSLALSVTADHQHLISGSCDMTLRQWNITTGQCDHMFEGHDSWITACCVTSDDSTLVSGAVEKCIKLWDLASGICLQTLTDSSYVSRLCLSHDNTRLASLSSCTAAGEIKLWSLSTGESIDDAAFQGHSAGITSVAFSANDTQLLTSGGDHSIRVFSVQDGRSVHTLEKCHTKTIQRCCWLRVLFFFKLL